MKKIILICMLISGCALVGLEEEEKITAGGGSGGGNTGGSSASVPNLTPQSRLSAGGDTNAYILDNGSVVQWGYESGANNAKTIVDNLTNARQVSTFGTSGDSYGAHTCVITTDNTSVCWGENSKGQLGDNTTTHCGVGSSPAYQKSACAVPIFDDSTAQGNLNKVVAGSRATFWLDNNGKLYSAGQCESGRLGISCGGGNQKTATTVMTGVEDVDMHRGIACALKTDSTLHCWGENSGNDITNDNTSDIQTPIQIATNVKHFDVAGNHVTMVHDNDTVFCTDNWYTKSSNIGKCADKFSSYTNVKRIYATQDVTGLLLDNGSQVSYGVDSSGLLADKSGGSPATNLTVTHGWIQEDGSQSLTNNITHIDGGGSDHAIGIMDNGSVIGVGSNSEGQLGGTASNLTCYWNGTPTTPCPVSATANDVWIYLNLSPTQVGP